VTPPASGLLLMECVNMAMVVVICTDNDEGYYGTVNCLLYTVVCLSEIKCCWVYSLFPQLFIVNAS